MALAAEAGHRVVLVLATKGEQGEPVDGVLSEGETLGERRTQEAQLSGEILGAHRVEFLGYEDSGMIGEPTNDNPACFWQADVGEAAVRLAAILNEEDADILTVYDDHGGYGHPDHINVHRVGIAAAGLAGTPKVFMSTMNRTRMQALMAESKIMQESFQDDESDEPPTVDTDTFGTPEDIITHAVDVTSRLAQKRASMAAHASQISEEDFFLKLPLDQFAMAFGTEWYIDGSSPRSAGQAFVPSLFD